MGEHRASFDRWEPGVQQAYQILSAQHKAMMAIQSVVDPLLENQGKNKPSILIKIREALCHASTVDEYKHALELLSDTIQHSNPEAYASGAIGKLIQDLLSNADKF
jgi:hypothetical protein